MRSGNSPSRLFLLTAGILLCGFSHELGMALKGLEAEMTVLPAAPGSRSPKLSTGPEGNLVLSWMEPESDGYTLRFSVLHDQSWNTARTIARGDNWFVNWADFPSVVPISENVLAAHWLVRQPAGGYAYDVLFSLSQDGGDTWSEAVMPHDDGTATEHGFVTLFPHAGATGLVWLDGRETAANPPPDDRVGGMTLRAAAIDKALVVKHGAQIDSLVCDCCQTDVALTDAGPVVVYRNRTPDETRDIYVSRYTNGEWQTGNPVANDGWTIGGCPVNGPVIAARGNHVAVAWFTSANEQARVRVARSRDGGASFLPPLEVNDGETSGRAGMHMLDDGSLVVSWLCKQPDGSTAMCLRHFTPDDHPGPVYKVSGDDRVPSLSVPQLERNGDFLHAVWSVSKDSGGGIKASRIPISALR